MKKNISAALLSLACFSAVAAAAYADGPVAGAINGIERAGEDIVNGAGDAIDGAVKGISGATDDIMGLDLDGDEGGLTPGGSDSPEDPNSSDPDTSDTTSDDSSDTTDSDTSGDSATSDPEISDTSSDASSDDSGAVGGINDANPGTGVTYGLSAAAAVLAAIGVVAATSRKNK